MRKTAVAGLLAALAMSANHSYAESDKLLLSEHSSKIKMSFRVDGKAVRASVVNQSPLALTSGTLVCAPYDLNHPRPKVAPDGRKICAEIGNPFEASLALNMTPRSCVLDMEIDALRFPFETTVLPGKSQEVYAEVYRVSFPVTSCRLEDLRGREKKIWDF